MEHFARFMQFLNGIVWGPYMIALLVGTGLYLTCRLGLVQVRYFGYGLRCLGRQQAGTPGQGDISPLQALAAELSACVGTGNIAGVATAIALGGPGALFWMWMTALVGMATKFTCCSLAVRFRIVNPDGTVSGGPMYYLSNGLGLPWLGVLFALFAGVASFGIGCAVQSNSVADGLLSLMPQHLVEYRIPETAPFLKGTSVLKPILGLVMAFLVGIVIIGGIRRIAHVASAIVPFMCAVYVGGALLVLARYASELPEAFANIFRYAFTPIAVGGGFFGVVVQRTVQKGVARGVFSNEAGLGSAPIAHAAARTKEMIRQGFIAMFGPFVDTIVVCTMTGLAILVTGSWQVQGPDGEVLYGPGSTGVPFPANIHGETVQVVGDAVSEEFFLDAEGRYYPVPTGAALTATSFEKGVGRLGKWVVALGIVLFAYSTMISWSYYGDRCWSYLLGQWAILPYRCLFCVFVVIGTISGLDLVWLVADNLNALMAVPNLIGVLGLSGVVANEMKSYLRRGPDKESPV